MSSFWRDKRIFITGSTGFLGGHVARYLCDQRADVVVLVRDYDPKSLIFQSLLTDKLKVVRGDLKDYSVVERIINEEEIDFVFHFAAQTIVGISRRAPAETIENNVLSTLNILEACRCAGNVKSIVVASSDKAYGPSLQPYTENMPLSGELPYDVSKSCSDLIASCYYKTYNLPLVVTRNANLYGPFDFNFNRIIPGTIRSIARNQRPIIRSSGSLIRSYFYIDDAVRAVIQLAERLSSDRKIAGEAFNFSSGEARTGLEVVDMILHLMESPLQPIILDEARGEITTQILNSDKARRILGWKSEWVLKDGLVPTIEWYKKYLQ
jgi:CDP-glucose 4,6-dehydratase